MNTQQITQAIIELKEDEKENFDVIHKTRGAVDAHSQALADLAAKVQQLEQDRHVHLEALRILGDRTVNQKEHINALRKQVASLEATLTNAVDKIVGDSQQADWWKDSAGEEG